MLIVGSRLVIHLKGIYILVSKLVDTVQYYTTCIPQPILQVRFHLPFYTSTVFSHKLIHASLKTIWTQTFLVFLSGFPDAALQGVHKKWEMKTQPVLHYHVKLSSWFVFVLFLPGKENIDGEEYFCSQKSISILLFHFRRKKKSVSFVFGHSLLSAQPPAKLKMR